MGESRDVWMMDGYKIISIPHNKVVRSSKFILQMRKMTLKEVICQSHS